MFRGFAVLISLVYKGDTLFDISIYWLWNTFTPNCLLKIHSRCQSLASQKITTKCRFIHILHENTRLVLLVGSEVSLVGGWIILLLLYPGSLSHSVLGMSSSLDICFQIHVLFLPSTACPTNYIAFRVMKYEVTWSYVWITCLFFTVRIWYLA